MITVTVPRQTFQNTIEEFISIEQVPEELQEKLRMVGRISPRVLRGDFYNAEVGFGCLLVQAGLAALLYNDDGDVADAIMESGISEGADGTFDSLTRHAPYRPNGVWKSADIIEIKD